LTHLKGLTNWGERWDKIYNNKEVYSEKKQLIFLKIIKLYCIPNQNKTSPFRMTGGGVMELQLRLKNGAKKKATISDCLCNLI
jgi:hypothetical protein